MVTYRDSNFFGKYNVSSTNFPSAPQAKWNFTSGSFSIILESTVTTDVIQYSFDGSTVHGDMTPGFASEALAFDGRLQNSIWFRRESSGEPVTVRVESWRVT